MRKGVEQVVQKSGPSTAIASAEPDEDAALLARHVAGDSNAFPQLVQRFRRPVYGYLTRCGLPRDARDDLFQEIILNVHRGAPSYRQQRGLRTWLFTIMTNTVRSHFRKARVRSVVVLSEETDTAVDDSPSLDAMTAAKQTAQWLERAIGALPIDQREVLLLARVERLSMKEIADIVDRPINSVKTILRRARLELASQLARREQRVVQEVGS